MVEIMRSKYTFVLYAFKRDCLIFIFLGQSDIELKLKFGHSYRKQIFIKTYDLCESLSGSCVI